MLATHPNLLNRVYREVFKVLLYQALHVEANEPLLKLRSNRLGLRLLYKLKSNPTFIESVVTLDKGKPIGTTKIKRLPDQLEST